VSLPNEKVLDEFDQLEMHARRLARRVDAVRPGAMSQELAVAHRLHKAIEGALQSLPGDDNAMRQMMSVWLRSDALREVTADLATAVSELGANVAVDDIVTELRRGFERMPSILDRHRSENPSDGFLRPVEHHDAEQYELAFDVIQRELLRIDLALDEFGRA
jgi:hypothetical protein